MADAARSERWDRASLLVATILNARPGVTRSKRIDALKIHPYANRRARRPLEGRQRSQALDAWFGPASRTQ